MFGAKQVTRLYPTNVGHFTEQAGKLVLARSPMQVKIWPGKWKQAWASGILYRLYKRLPSLGECQIFLVSQPAEEYMHLQVSKR